MQIRIGISGPMGSGKTTIANALNKRIVSTIIPMAKPLKDYARSLGWNGKKDAKGRRLLQLLGTECGRKCIDQNLWTTKWLEECASLEPGVTVICDDVRFPNEAVLFDAVFKLPMRFDECHPIAEHKCWSFIAYYFSRAWKRFRYTRIGSIFRHKSETLGFGTPVPAGTPDEMAAFIVGYVSRMATVISRDEIQANKVLL